MNKPNPEQLEELRVRVAELCGWTFNGSTKFGRGCCPRRPGDMQYVGTMNIPMKEQWTPPVDWDGHPGTPLPPNYPEDLNACRGAWVSLVSGDYSHEDQFSIELLRVCGSENPDDGGRPNFSDEMLAIVSNAEAWRRCIALDRTLSEHPIL